MDLSDIIAVSGRQDYLKYKPKHEQVSPLHPY